MNNIQRGLAVGLAATSLVVFGAAAQAQTFIPGNLNISTALTGNVAVGYANKTYTNPTSPIVNLNSGGSVDYFLNVFNSSVLNMTAGTVFGDFYAFDNSLINISGGTIGGHLYGYTNSVITIYGTLTIASGTHPLAGFNDFIVNGTLLDGTTLTNKDFYVHSDSAAMLINGGVTIRGIGGAVPEPGSIALLAGLGVTSAGFLARRRRSKIA